MRRPSASPATRSTTPGGSWPPSRCRGRAGSTAARTGRTRNTGRRTGGDLLDPRQLRLQVRVGGLLPCPRALEGDLVGVQDLPQPLPPEVHPPVRDQSRVGVSVPAAQVGGQLAHAPPGERQPQVLRAGGGRRDDDSDLSVTDPAGKASRPPRAQRGQPPFVERLHHIPHRVLPPPHPPQHVPTLTLTHPTGPDRF